MFLSLWERLFRLLERKRSTGTKNSTKMASNFLKYPVKTKETETGRGDMFNYAVTTCQGWRRTQEDMHLVIEDLNLDSAGPKTSLFAVFDGHNGVEVAEYAAKHLPDQIRNSPKYQAGAIEAGLKEAFLELDKAVKRNLEELTEIRNRRHPNLLDMHVEPGVHSGCTAVVCLLVNDTFYCANLGDSRCVLCRAGTAFPLSFDHNPELPTEAERIEKAGGMVKEGRINLVINVSRAFGDHSFKENSQLPATEQMIIALPEVTVTPFNRDTDQALILMCDGIWNSMDNDAVVRYVAEQLERNTPLSAITEQIIAEILPDKLDVKTGIKGKDNMTMMVIKFVEPSDKQPK